jgi:hypothetical protein
MSLYQTVLEEIKRNRHLKEEGKFVGIPYPFKRLSEFIPVIEKGHSIGVLAPTGSGKSRFARYVFIYHVYKFYKETGYKVKIVYFPLEDSAHKVFLNIICHYLYEQHGIYITLQELTSKGDRSLPAFVEEKLDEAYKYFEDFEDIVYVIDGMNKPDDIAEFGKKLSRKLGTMERFDKFVEGEKVEQYRYISDTHVVMIVDNMSNIDGEEEQKEILRFARDIVRKVFCNIYNWTVVQVLQLDFASERQQYTKEGNTIVPKLEPTLAGIGDSKRVARSMHIIFSLFNPSRYDIMRYPIPPKTEGQNYYDIEILGNRYRSLRVLKSNDTDTGMRIGLLFDAVGENFTELPPYGTDELMQIYNKIKGKPNFIRAKNQIVFKEDEYETAPF